MVPESLTIVERQILANQFRILASLKESNDSEIIAAKILENGYAGQYGSVFNVDNEISKEVCDETSQILNMYRRINSAIAHLSDEENQGLDLKVIKFEGFDGNHDPHFGYMTFLVEEMNLWNEYKKAYLNSHSQFPLEKYRRMLAYQNTLSKPINFGLEDLKMLIIVAQG